MNKLLVKLALHILKHFSIQPVNVALGQRFFCSGRAFAITSTTMDMTWGQTSLTIKCVEDGEEQISLAYRRKPEEGGGEDV